MNVAADVFNVLRTHHNSRSKEILFVASDSKIGYLLWWEDKKVCILNSSKSYPISLNVYQFAAWKYLEEFSAIFNKENSLWHDLLCSYTLSIEDLYRTRSFLIASWRNSFKSVQIKGEWVVVPSKKDGLTLLFNKTFLCVNASTVYQFRIEDLFSDNWYKLLLPNIYKYKVKPLLYNVFAETERYIHSNQTVLMAGIPYVKVSINFEYAVRFVKEAMSSISNACLQDLTLMCENRNVNSNGRCYNEVKIFLSNYLSFLLENFFRKCREGVFVKLEGRRFVQVSKKLTCYEKQMYYAFGVIMGYLYVEDYIWDLQTIGVVFDIFTLGGLFLYFPEELQKNDFNAIDSQSKLRICIALFLLEDSRTFDRSLIDLVYDKPLSKKDVAKWKAFFQCGKNKLKSRSVKYLLQKSKYLEILYSISSGLYRYVSLSDSLDCYGFVAAKQYPFSPFVWQEFIDSVREFESDIFGLCYANQCIVSAFSKGRSISIEHFNRFNRYLNSLTSISHIEDFLFVTSLKKPISTGKEIKVEEDINLGANQCKLIGDTLFISSVLQNVNER